MPERSAIEKLSELLQAGHAKPQVQTDRLVPSAIYDLDYRIFVIAAAFELHAKPAPPIGRRIHATKLKLLQFIAIRPWLISVIKAWSLAKDDEELSFPAQDLRRGFLGDQTFDSTISFLVARGALEWMGTHLAAGANSGLLTNVYMEGVNRGLFGAERQTLEELAGVKVTVRMLEGA